MDCSNPRFFKKCQFKSKYYRYIFLLSSFNPYLIFSRTANPLIFVVIPQLISSPFRRNELLKSLVWQTAFGSRSVGLPKQMLTKQSKLTAIPTLPFCNNQEIFEQVSSCIL